MNSFLIGHRPNDIQLWAESLTIRDKLCTKLVDFRLGETTAAIVIFADLLAGRRPENDPRFHWDGAHVGRYGLGFAAPSNCY
ncbi:MAG TPA: hypothetical protein VNT79_04135 [Phycisphaerae bacterium]|nr:hypothetical protein [Phycisphaerae bacterium]